MGTFNDNVSACNCVLAGLAVASKALDFAFLHHSVDNVADLLSNLEVGLGAGKLNSHCLSDLLDLFGNVVSHELEENGSGPTALDAVRSMAGSGESVAGDVAQMYVGVNECKACPVGSESHLGTSFQVGAVLVALYEIVTNAAQCAESENLGVGVTVTAGDGLYAVSENVETGLSGNGGRTGEGENGVDDTQGSVGEDSALLAQSVVGNNGNLSTLRAGAGGGGSQDDGNIGLNGHGRTGHVLLDLGLLLVQQDSDTLCKVHAGAAADSENGVALFFDSVLGSLVDEGGGSIGSYFVPVGIADAGSLQALFALNESAGLGNVGTANEHELLAAELGQLFAYACDGAGSKDDGVKLGVSVDTVCHDIFLLRKI